MTANNKDFDDTLEAALRIHLQKYVDYFNRRSVSNPDLLEMKIDGEETLVIDRDLLVAYLSISAERKSAATEQEAAKDNKNLQGKLMLFAALSAAGTITQALVALVVAHIIG